MLRVPVEALPTLLGPQTADQVSSALAAVRQKQQEKQQYAAIAAEAGFTQSEFDAAVAEALAESRAAKAGAASGAAKAAPAAGG